MRKNVTALLLCIAALNDSNAHATPIQMDFTAYGFGVTAPTRPVTGRVQWFAETVNSRIEYLISIDLSLDGHTYSLEEVTFESPVGMGSDVIGGKLNSYNALGPGTDDFIMMWDRSSLTPNVFAYTSSAVPGGFWEGRLFRQFSVTEVVPAPATLALFGMALLCLGSSRRKAISHG